WRGSLLPLGCEAAPHPETEGCQLNRVRRSATAAQSSGSKLPRHKSS
ncbi:aldo/keto reductase, partial [Pseudomonas sp. MWU12-2312b]